MSIHHWLRRTMLYETRSRSWREFRRTCRGRKREPALWSRSSRRRVKLRGKRLVSTSLLWIKKQQTLIHKWKRSLRCFDVSTLSASATLAQWWGSCSFTRRLYLQCLTRTLRVATVTLRAPKVVPFRVSSDLDKVRHYSLHYSWHYSRHYSLFGDFNMIDFDSATERGEEESENEWYFNFIADEGDCCEASEYS